MIEQVTDKGIEILVELAQKGEIDPWNIDIMDVTDKYLATLEVRNDLRLPGRALFYAAVLLRLKSDALEEPEQEEYYDEYYEEDEPIIRPALTVLDGAIARRTSAKQQRHRPITLMDLIGELTRLESLDRPTTPQDNAMRRKSILPSHRVAHEEDIEGDIRKLRDILEDGQEVCLSTLFKDCQDQPGIYLALLFLESRGLIRMEQPEFYGDITIHHVEEEAHGIAA